MDIQPIRSEADHEAALAEIDRLWNAEPGSDDGEKLEILALLVSRYEEKHYPIPTARPHEVLAFVMEQNGYTQPDLAKLLGSRSRASELLSGKREPSLEQIRLLHREWHVPVEAMIRELA